MKKKFNYLLNEHPEGFVFKPACGTRNDEGLITVSGMEFAEEEIDTNGKRYDNLVSVFAQIKKEMDGKEKAKSKPIVTLGELNS